MDEKIFNEIANAGGIISGETVGNALGISKMAVNKHVKKLIAKGIPIETTSRGYCLSNADSLDEFTLGCKLKRAGLEHVKPIVQVVGSTNSAAKTIAQEQTGDFIYVAPYQTQGRGRNKRQFVSELGGLYMTYSMLTPGLLVTDALNIVLLSGLAVANVLGKYHIHAEIKWPNDVFVGGKKICGILLESNVSQSIIDRIFIGIGVNINNQLTDSISDIATNMRLQGASAHRESVAVEIVQEINKLMKDYISQGQSSFKKEYVKRSWTLGRMVNATVEGNEVGGFATDITELGYLKVETVGREHIIIAGDVM